MEPRLFDFPFFFFSRAELKYSFIIAAVCRRRTFPRVRCLFAAHTIAIDPRTEIQDNCIVSPARSNANYHVPTDDGAQAAHWFRFFACDLLFTNDFLSFYRIGLSLVAALPPRPDTVARAAYFIITRYSLLNFRCCCSRRRRRLRSASNEQTNEFVKFVYIWHQASSIRKLVSLIRSPPFGRRAPIQPNNFYRWSPPCFRYTSTTTTKSKPNRTIMQIKWLRKTETDGEKENDFCFWLFFFVVNPCDFHSHVRPAKDSQNQNEMETLSMTMERRCRCVLRHRQSLAIRSPIDRPWSLTLRPKLCSWSNGARLAREEKLSVEKVPPGKHSDRDWAPCIELQSRSKFCAYFSPIKATKWCTNCKIPMRPNAVTTNQCHRWVGKCR